mmetsp:Transcript_58794/g.131515  ORF Transcript_58794/g.131515 Transcript_58794/m.131515 type:complete len:129 (-) Transcript_58794:39-425(-)
MPDIEVQPPGNATLLTEGVIFNQMAREWRCKWSDGSGNISLSLCQRALMDVAVPALQYVPGAQVQRIISEERQDFKVIVKCAVSDFDLWKQAGFSPENEFLEALESIPGVSEVASQTYTIAPVCNVGR